MSEEKVMDQAQVVVEDTKEGIKGMDLKKALGFVKNHEVELSAGALAVGVGLLAWKLKKMPKKEVVEEVTDKIEDVVETAEDVAE